MKQTWATIKAVEELKKLGKKRKIKRKPLPPDNRKTTVHIHRIKGIYHVTMNPVKGPDDKEDPEPVVYTLERPEDGSDASEIELDLTVPDPPYPPPPKLKHQAQQFCEEDLPLIQPKKVFIKKKKKKEKIATRVVTSKKKKPGSAKSGKSDKSGKSGKSDKSGKSGKSGKPSAKEKQSSLKGKGKVAPGKDSSGKKAPAKSTPTKKGGKETATKGGKAQPPKPATPQYKKKKGKKKKDDEDDVYPWDEWIMKIKCKNKQSPDD